MRKSVLFYSDWYEILRELPDDERVRAYDAIMQFAFEDIEPTDKYIKAITALIFKGIERNSVKYSQKCEKLRQNINKRWQKQKNTNVYKSIQKDTNEYNCIQTIQIDYDNVNDNVNDNDVIVAKATDNNKEIKENIRKENKEKAHDFLDQFFSKDITIDQFCKHNKTNRQELREMAEGIVIEWDMAHIIHNDFEEACREMTNKLSYRLRNKKNMTSNPTNEIDNRPPCPGPGHVWSDPLQEWVYVK